MPPSFGWKFKPDDEARPAVEPSARTDPEGEHRQRIDGTGTPDPIERGRLAGAETSVRAQWRVDTVRRDAKPNAPPEELGTDQIVLVQVRLYNPDPVEQRVSVRNALDGPVLFPRRRGVAEAGWERDGFVGAVPAAGRRALGYACPASVRTPPIELDRAREGQRADESKRTDRNQGGRSRRRSGSHRRNGGRRNESRQTSEKARGGHASENEDDSPLTPEAVIRTHGDATPPAAVVWDSDRVAVGESGRRPSRSKPSGGRDDAGSGAETVERERGGESTPPPAVTAWLDDIESRITRAERLEDASVREATAVLTEADGLDPALDDAERLPAVARELRALAARATDLADRTDAVTVPEEALRRLA